MFEIEAVWIEYMNSNIDLRNTLSCAWLFVVFFISMVIAGKNFSIVLIASPLILGLAFLFFMIPISIISISALLLSPVAARYIYDKYCDNKLARLGQRE